MKIVKSCLKHGETEFAVYGRLGDRSYREVCIKCRSERVANRRAKLKELAVEYKGGSCVKCGYSKCLRALEFHHINPSEKDFSISADGNTRSFEKLKVELDKCIMVCANCHREIHELIDNQSNQEAIGS